MACGARWGLKRKTAFMARESRSWLNGLWSPLGIETLMLPELPFAWQGLNGLGSPLGIETIPHGFVHPPSPRGLNGLGSPLGIETATWAASASTATLAKWPVEPVGD